MKVLSVAKSKNSLQRTLGLKITLGSSISQLPSGRYILRLLGDREIGAVWHLANVVDWLTAKSSYTVDAKLADTAMVTMQVNIAKESKQVQSRTQHALRELIA